MQHYTKTILSAVVALAVIWAIGFAAFVSKIEKMAPTEKVGKGIVVLTGGEGRIAAGLDLLETDDDRKLLISGVDKTVSKETLANLSGHDLELYSCCVTLDYEAGDTIENAIEATSWAKNNKLKSLTIVTADYHMPRALIAFENANEKLKYLPHPVKANVSPRYLIIEYNKYIVALLSGPKS